jgi:thiol-disulfide isomerase/thioredoxin
MNRFRLASSALALLAALPVAGQEIPADPVFSGFVPIGDYVLTVNGAPTDADLYRSDKAGSALLIVSDAFAGPLLVSPRQRTVQSMDRAKVALRDDGSADILSDASFASQGSFRVEGDEVAFAVAGRQVRLEQKPDLVGWHEAAALLAHSPEYGYLKGQYTPSPPMVRALREVGQPIEVKIYFGSWCPYCKQMLPRLLKVAEQLDGSRIDFRFYGLPKGFGDEPEAKRLGITGVPTAVVLRGGRELGRIEGADWKIPELALKNLVG